MKARNRLSAMVQSRAKGGRSDSAQDFRSGIVDDGWHCLGSFGQGAVAADGR